MKTFTTTEAARNIGAVVDEAAGNTVWLNRRGRPVAVVLGVHQYNNLTKCVDALKGILSVMPDEHRFREGSHLWRDVLPSILKNL